MIVIFDPPFTYHKNTPSFLEMTYSWLNDASSSNKKFVINIYTITIKSQSIISLSQSLKHLAQLAISSTISVMEKSKHNVSPQHLAELVAPPKHWYAIFVTCKKQLSTLQHKDHSLCIKVCSFTSTHSRMKVAWSYAQKTSESWPLVP